MPYRPPPTQLQAANLHHDGDWNYKRQRPNRGEDVVGISAFCKDAGNGDVFHT